MSVSENGMLKRIFGPKIDGAGENYIENFVILTPYQILLG
jgi:hypothetical protein